MTDSCKIKYYVPAHDEAALKEAIDSDADIIVMDLEQNCPADKRGIGRELVQHACSEMDFKGSSRWVRVNICSSKEQEEDLKSLEHLPDGLVLASAQDAQETLGLAKLLVEVERRAGVAPGTIPILPNIESAMGLRNAFEIAGCSARISEMGLGGGDMLRDLGGIRTPDGGELYHVRARLAVEGRAAGVSLMDTVTPLGADEEYLVRDTREAFKLGFKGRAVLGSGQIEPIRQVWSKMSQG